MKQSPRFANPRANYPGMCMTLKTISSIILILGLTVLQSCSPSGGSSSGNGRVTPAGGTNDIKNRNPGTGDIAIFGDSIAHGLGSTKQEFIPLNCLSNSFKANTYDYSINGHTSEQILQRINLATKQSLRLVFLSAGGNDVLQEMNQAGRYPKEKTISQMTQIFDQLLSTSAVVVYLELNPPVPQASRLPEVAALAKSKGILVVDGMRGFWNNTTYMSDSIHPNDFGYEIMCARILSSLNGYYP